MLCVCIGDLIWILTQSQLRAVSRLTQSLMDAAVRTAQQQRGEQDDSDRDSDISMDSVSSERGTQRSYNMRDKVDEKQQKKKKKKRPSKSSSQRQKVIEERITQYREGRKNLPPYEIIQNSFHVKTGKMDLQLCDDMGDSGVTDTVQGTMLIEVRMQEVGGATGVLGMTTCILCTGI